MKVAVVTDSTAYLPSYLREELKIEMIPLAVTLNNTVYYEEVDISSREFYKKVKETEEIPKTSQPSIGQFQTLFESLQRQGVTDIVSVHLSSGISGTYDCAIQAGELVDHVTVHAFDSEISCHMQGFYAIRAAQMANEGAEPKEILAQLEKMRTTMDAYFMVDDLSHLQRGGRLSGTQAFIGSMLQIKPILQFQEKTIVPYEKIRTAKKALNRMTELLKQSAQNGPLEVVIIHGNRPEEARKWREHLMQELPNLTYTISHFGPVIGTHLGEGAMGLGWVKL